MIDACSISWWYKLRGADNFSVVMNFVLINAHPKFRNQLGVLRALTTKHHILRRRRHEQREEKASRHRSRRRRWPKTSKNSRSRNLPTCGRPQCACTRASTASTRAKAETRFSLNFSPTENIARHAHKAGTRIHRQTCMHKIFAQIQAVSAKRTLVWKMMTWLTMTKVLWWRSSVSAGEHSLAWYWRPSPSYTSLHHSSTNTNEYVLVT